MHSMCNYAIACTFGTDGTTNLLSQTQSTKALFCRKFKILMIYAFTVLIFWGPKELVLIFTLFATLLESGIP